MKIIVAGYSKTGTKSMCKALSILGYTVFDFMEHCLYHAHIWNKFMTTGGSTEEFQEMYKDIDAVTDLPANMFWEEIHNAFPEAKIILTIRDEDSWYRSFVKQFKEVKSVRKNLQFLAASTRLNPKRVREYLQFLKNYMRVMFGSHLEAVENELVDKMFYRRHNSYVFQAAPKDKLLVFKVTDGWEPLCNFLEKEVPHVPFPHLNKNCSVADDILSGHPIAVENLRIAKRRLYIFGILVSTIVAAVVLSLL